MYSFLLLIFVYGVASETKWVEIPKTKVQYTILWNSGKFQQQSLPEGVLACGIGPGVVYFRSPGGSCPTANNISLEYGAANLHQTNKSTCFEAGITLLEDNRMSRYPIGDRQAVFNSLGAGCKGTVLPALAYGTITTSLIDPLSSRVVLAASSRIEREGYLFCSVQTGTCQPNAYTSGLVSERIYFSINYGSIGYLLGSEINGISSNLIRTPDKTRYFPSSTSVNMGTPMGITFADYFRSSLRATALTTPNQAGSRKRRSIAGIGYASGVLAYTIVVRNAVSAGFRQVDANFVQAGEATNKLFQHSYELAQVMSSFVEAIPSTFEQLELLNAKNQFTWDMLSELTEKANNMESFNLQLVDYLQTEDLSKIQGKETVKARVKEIYPNWNITSLQESASIYLVQLQKGSLMNPEAPALDCSSQICFLEGDWNFFDGRTLRTVTDVYANSMACGVYYQDDTPNEVIRAQLSVRGALVYLRQYSYEFVSPLATECPVSEIGFPQSRVYGELKRRMARLSEGMITLDPNGNYKIQCNESGELRLNFPAVCETYLDQNDILTVLDTIQPERISFRMVAAQFDDSTIGFQVLAKLAGTMGTVLGETLGALAELPKGFVSGLLNWTEGVDTKLTIVFVLIGIELAFLALLYFLALKERLKSSREGPQLE